jgi:hypothetical protein
VNVTLAAFAAVTAVEEERTVRVAPFSKDVLGPGSELADS